MIKMDVSVQQKKSVTVLEISKDEKSFDNFFNFACCMDSM